MIDLIDKYYKNQEIVNDNELIFVCNEEDIASEINKNKKIKDYIKPDNNILKITTFLKEKTKKINYIEDTCPSFGIFLSNEKKVSDLIDIYYEKKNIKNENKKIFLCDGDNLTLKREKYIGEIQKNSFILDVLVYDIISLYN